MKLVAAIGAMLASTLMLGAGSSPSPSPTGSAPPGPGGKAPAVVLQSVIGGKVESYDLQAAVAQRPVVLYFFLKAFTSG